MGGGAIHERHVRSVCSFVLFLTVLGEPYLPRSPQRTHKHRHGVSRLPPVSFYRYGTERGGGVRSRTENADG